MFRHMGINLSRYAVPAGHGRGGQDHEHDEYGLHDADPRKATRGSRVGHAPASHGRAPPNQREHRAELENENRRQQAHLRPEDVVVEIVEAALFEPAERPAQARADPQQGGDAPPGIGVEDAPQSGDVERRLQRAGASPDSPKSYTEREQMECGQEPSDRHVVSQARSHTQGTPSSWPSSIRYSSSNFRACPTQLAPISPRLRPSGTRSAGSAR